MHRFCGSSGVRPSVELTRFQEPFHSVRRLPRMKTITHLDDDDLEEIFSRASGPGGQNVNKVSTRVSLRHVPTGIIVHVQEARTQAANRRIARERLLREIQERQASDAARIRDEREKKRRRNRPKPAKVKRVQVESKRRRAETKKLRGRIED